MPRDRVRNLTPHDIVVLAVPTTIPSDGLVARVAVFSYAVEMLDTDHGPIARHVMQTGQVTDLPEPEPGVWLIVSTMVAQAAPGRTDLLVPHGLVRGEDGQIIGCTGLAQLGAHQLGA